MPQANKNDLSQGSILDYLNAYSGSPEATVAVVGCGPAGLALSANLAKEGVPVVVIGRLKYYISHFFFVFLSW